MTANTGQKVRTARRKGEELEVTDVVSEPRDWRLSVRHPLRAQDRTAWREL